MKKKIIYTGISVLSVLALLVAGTGWYMLDYALAPDAGRKDTARHFRQMLSDNPWVKPWVDSLRAVGALRDTFVVMPGGERHHALFVRNRQAAGRTAVLVHGYKDTSVRMLPIARIYELMGYNILLPDLHAHGLSDGDAIQMGWNDRHDVMRWIGVAEKMFADSAAGTRIVLHGVSMGAATVMNVSGEKLPESVRCVVEDCGFTSAWDEFGHQLREQFGLPDFPVLHAASVLCRLRYGWTFGEASPVRQLKKRHTPMLYIHGTSDDYVPSQMVFPLYNANPVYENRSDGTLRYNSIWVTPGCAHAVSYRDYPYEYSRRVEEFVNEKVGI